MNQIFLPKKSSVIVVRAKGRKIICWRKNADLTNAVSVNFKAHSRLIHLCRNL